MSEVLEPSEQTVRTRAAPSVFYRYEAPDGRLVIVDSLSKLPPQAREQAERLDLSSEAASGTASSGAGPGAKTRDTSVVAEAPSGVGESGLLLGLDGASFGFGLGAGVLAGGVLVALLRRGPGTPRTTRWLVIGLVVAGLSWVGAGLYLGGLRRVSGQGDGRLMASPKQLVDDARRAVEQMNERQQERERELDTMKQWAK